MYTLIQRRQNHSVEKYWCPVSVYEYCSYRFPWARRSITVNIDYTTWSADTFDNLHEFYNVDASLHQMTLLNRLYNEFIDCPLEADVGWRRKPVATKRLLHVVADYWQPH